MSASGRPLLLDLFCGGGGASHGYFRAGFHVTGVDNFPRRAWRHYQIGPWHETDALDFVREHGHEFDVIHASPPCQANLFGLAAVNRKLGRKYAHVDLIEQTREALRATGKPYVIEQPQQGAKLIDPVVCCGSSFGLPIRRHRQFESNLKLVAPPCNHAWQTEKKYWTSWVRDGVRQAATVVQVYGNGGDQHLWGPALGIEWLPPDLLREAIPPAYTEFLGRQLIAYVAREGAMVA